MADGFTIEARGATEAQRELMERAARMADLSPVLRVVAAEIEKLTDDAFRDSKSPFGEPFPALAPSTIKARVAKLPGAKRRTKAGKLSSKATKIRAAAIAAPASAIKPMVDTARARNSQHAVVVGKSTIEWSAVDYLGPHITGGKRLPKRNVSVFNVVNGQPIPHPRIHQLIVEGTARYVQTGRVS